MASHVPDSVSLDEQERIFADLPALPQLISLDSSDDIFEQNESALDKTILDINFDPEKE